MKATYTLRVKDTEALSWHLLGTSLITELMRRARQDAIAIGAIRRTDTYDMTWEIDGKRMFVIRIFREKATSDANARTTTAS